MDIFLNLGTTVIISIAVILLAIIITIMKCFNKVQRGTAIVRTGFGAEPRVSFTGILVFPIIHKKEIIDISLKKIEIERSGKEGLVCKDNMRADIRVTFFMRINDEVSDVKNVASTLGCAITQNDQALSNLFDAKFSEALKSVGKKFDFVELYTGREQFKNDIIELIGSDLNGYHLDDAAIDYLEQTPLDLLDEENILDSEGIKKITELTSAQKVKANKIEREKEKVIKQQDVEAKEAILELEKQKAEAEEKQKREIAIIKSREEAEAAKVREEERLKSEQARITTEEELQIANQNKERQVIIAEQSKLRTEAVEKEKVAKDRELEVIERERVLELTRIEKEKAVEEEKKNIQDVIRERVIVEKAVVVEQEKIKDTEAFATAERDKQVTVVSAQKEAEENMVREVKKAEADKASAELKAKQTLIDAEAYQKAAELKADAMKILADGKAAEEATIGMSEVSVMEAKADAERKFGIAEAEVIEAKIAAEARGQEAKAVALEKEGDAEANILEGKMLAEAKGKEAQAEALEKEGMAEAKILQEKLNAEAKGIENKAEAMKKLDGVGKEHEEFKLRLEKDTEIELAQISVQKDIAAAQAEILKSGLSNANIDLVGGDAQFIDKLMGAVSQAKTIDRLVNTSSVLTDVKDTFFNGDGEYFKNQLKGFIDKFNINTESLKNLSISALIQHMISQSSEGNDKTMLNKILDMVKASGLTDVPATILGK